MIRGVIIKCSRTLDVIGQRTRFRMKHACWIIYRITVSIVAWFLTNAIALGNTVFFIQMNTTLEVMLSSNKRPAWWGAEWNKRLPRINAAAIVRARHVSWSWRGEANKVLFSRPLVLSTGQFHCLLTLLRVPRCQRKEFRTLRHHPQCLRESWWLSPRWWLRDE